MAKIKHIQFYRNGVWSRQMTRQDFFRATTGLQGIEKVVFVEKISPKELKKIYAYTRTGRKN